MKEPTDPRAYVRARLAASRPKYVWNARAAADPSGWRRRVRTGLREKLGGLSRWERPPLDTAVEESVPLDSFRRERITFTTRPGLRACGYLLVPRTPNGAALVALPGHGIGADGVGGVRDEPYQAEFGAQCARRGYVTLVLEQMSFGRRRDAQAARAGGGSASCTRDSMAALMLGENMTGWRVWDTMRALDLLAARPEVDPKRLGTIGISGGGLTSLHTAAVDERVKACVVSGYFNTFADSILAVDHCVDNYVPGMLDLCEMPDLAGLVAPRWLFCESGADDPIFPLPAFERAAAHARRIYADLGVAERFGSEVFPGDHHFHGVGAFAFLERNLSRP